MYRAYIPAFLSLAILISIFSVKVATSSSLTSSNETNPQPKGIVKQTYKSLERITPEDKKNFEKLLKKVLGISLYEDKRKASPEILNYRWRSGADKNIIRTYATSFGKPGNKGESKYFKDGSKVRWGIVAVALPDPSAIGKWVVVRRIKGNGNKTPWVKMKVKDLGPWFRDDPYWKRKSGIPRAVNYFKKGKRRFDGKVVVNPAGIDITPWGWQKLGIPLKKSHNHSQYVEWKFVG